MLAIASAGMRDPHAEQVRQHFLVAGSDRIVGQAGLARQLGLSEGARHDGEGSP
jgi:hypothetical protein